ncbi:hypothetical protein HanIR_Chr01g0025421 [Helianthus annuus]|nr:hypothetical protein HanIR_Chr01g0025421 [Helianthus annuus]
MASTGQRELCLYKGVSSQLQRYSTHDSPSLKLYYLILLSLLTPENPLLIFTWEPSSRVNVNGASLFAHSIQGTSCGHES